MFLLLHPLVTKTKHKTPNFTLSCSLLPPFEKKRGQSKSFLFFKKKSLTFDVWYWGFSQQRVQRNKKVKNK